MALMLTGACSSGEVEQSGASGPTEAPQRERASPSPEAGPDTESAGERDGDGPAVTPESDPSVPSSGAYVYELSTKDSGDTFTDEVRVEATDAGRRIRVESRSSRSRTTATTMLRWGEDGIFLTERTVRLSPELAFPCRIDADVRLLRFPVRPEDYPDQEWENEGCSGSVETSVEGADEGAAAGRSWSAWRIRRHVTMTTRSTDGEHTFATTYDETSWWSPELGKEIVRDRRSRGRIDGRESEERVVPVLREYPGAP